MIRIAIVTVSDSVCAGSRVDESGPAVRKRAEALGWEIAIAKAVPDETGLIATLLVSLAEDPLLSAIFTTGGTGVAPRDVTPDATRTAIEREIPGLSEWMRAKGRESTPFASLSRGIAGSRGKVLIVNLPGSPKGAVESLDTIADLVPHVLALLRGETGHTTNPERSGTA